MFNPRTDLVEPEPTARALNWLDSQLSWERRFNQLRAERANGRSPDRELREAHASAANHGD